MHALLATMFEMNFAPAPFETLGASNGKDPCTCIEQPWERGRLALGEGRMPSLQACSLRASAAGTAVTTCIDV